MLRTRIPPRLADLHASDYAPLDHLPREDFDACFKFAVMRKLYASAVSEERYRCAGAGMSVHDFLALRFDSDFSNDAQYPVPQSRCAKEGSINLIVDHLVRFEALDAGLRKVCRKLCGVEQPPVHRTIRSLPKALAGTPAEGRYRIPALQRIRRRAARGGRLDARAARDHRRSLRRGLPAVRLSAVPPLTGPGGPLTSSRRLPM
jgi:hypothetical protein